MVTNSKEYMKEYMKNYNLKNSYKVTCSICNSTFKKYHEYKHNQSQRHLLVEAKLCEMENRMKAGKKKSN